MTKAGPGKPPLDIAQRVRAACFHSAVVAATGWSNARLDQYFVDRHLANLEKDSRVFQRMGLRGTDPDTKPSMQRRGFSVVQKVAEHQEARVAQCAEVYRTLLWELLLPPRNDYGAFKRVANLLLANRASRSPGEEVVFALHTNDMREEDSLDPSGGYEHGVRDIADSATFDALALLCALKHEAQFYRAHRFAECIESYLPRAHLRACARYDLSADAAKGIETLVTTRLIHDNWNPRVSTSHLTSAREERLRRGKAPLSAVSVWSDVYALAEAVPSRMFTTSTQRRVIRLSDE